MNKLIALAAASCCVLFAGSGQAKAATLLVNPKSACFDLNTNPPAGNSPAYLALPNHKYAVSITSTANVGASGGALDKVYFYLQTPNRPFSSLNIVSTVNSNNFTVNGNGSHFQNGITAFIVDVNCGDNTGTITMTITPTQ